LCVNAGAVDIEGPTGIGVWFALRVYVVEWYVNLLAHSIRLAFALPYRFVYIDGAPSHGQWSIVVVHVREPNLHTIVNVAGPQDLGVRRGRKTRQERQKGQSGIA